ncbi:hypothetical protein CK215_23935, partial [Mesorhizobium sp. WSM3864]|uniref:hypothetical protein n=1 Tax=Mesorhizobium sp. WSM3864 TaxID=2029404 RepID=UPI000BCA5A75
APADEPNPVPHTTQTARQRRPFAFAALPSSSTRLFAAMVARACVVGTMLEEESFAVRVESTTGAFVEPAVPKSA